MVSLLNSIYEKLNQEEMDNLAAFLDYAGQKAFKSGYEAAKRGDVAHWDHSNIPVDEEIIQRHLNG